MTRLSALLALYVGLGNHFFQTAVAAPGTKCSTDVTASPPNASSGRVPSSQTLSGSGMSSRQQPSGAASSSFRASSQLLSGSGLSSQQQPSGTGPSSFRTAPTGAASVSRQSHSATVLSSSRQAPSGSASSSRQALSGTGPLPSSASDSCSPYSTTTSYLTTTTYALGTIVASNTTGTRYEYTSIVTETASTPYTNFVFAYIATNTVTRTFSSSSISVVPAATTVTVPTPADFTPILCLPAWRNPRVTTTITVYTTSYSYPITTSTYTTPGTITEHTSTTEVTTTQSYTTEVTIYETSISVTTRDNPTSTVYEACATNNVVSEGPAGEELSIPLPIDFSLISLKVVPALDPTDCCALCQVDPSCTSSSGIYPDGPDGRYSCQFNVKTAAANATCDPTFKALDATDSSLNSQLFTTLWLSNGPCGQYT